MVSKHTYMTKGTKHDVKRADGWAIYHSCELLMWRQVSTDSAIHANAKASWSRDDGPFNSVTRTTL